MPALQPAVRPSFSPPSKDPFPYSTTSMMNSLDRVTSSKKGASTSKNNMYSSNAMTLKEHPLLQSSSTKLSTSQSASPPKPKKATPRPTTPHGNNNNGQKNFVERNKQLASSPKVATAAPVKLTPTKSLSPPVSPQPTLKRTAAQSSRPIAEKPSGTSKKSTDVPTTVQKSAAHTRSHAAAPRATSPDASLLENLIRENKKLKELLGERSEELREAENDIEEFQEVIEALQERVKQVEARNRELQTENDILRKKVVENAVKEQATAAAQSPSNILSAIMNNQKKIRGEETSEPVPVIAPIVKIPPIIPTTALITPPAIDSTPAPQTSALSNLLLASKSNVSKVNDANVVEPEALVQSSRNLTPATTPAENPQQPRYHPAMMQKLGRAEPSVPKNEMLDRHVEMIRDREAANKAKAAAALNAVMEESDESEGEDEYPFGRDEDDIPDIQTFSDTSSSPDEDCENELIKTDFRLAPINGSHACAAIEEEDEEEDEATEIQKVAPLPEYIQKLKSTNLNDIPEDDEDEDDEFDLPPNLLNNPKQHLDQISTAAMKSSVAPSQTKKSTHRRLRRYSSANSSNSDSGIGSAQTSPQTSNAGQTTFDITSQSINADVTNASQKFADSFSVNGYSQKFQNFDDNDEKQDNLHRGSITSTYSDDSDTPSHSSTSTTHSSQSSNSSACGSFQPFTSCTGNNAQQTSDKHYRRSSNQETPSNDICSQFGENANVYSQQNDLINENLEYGNQGYYSRQSVTNSQRSNNVNNDYPNNGQRSQSTSSRRQSSASEHSMPPVSRQPSPTQSVSSRSSKVNDYIRAQSPANSSRSSTPMSDYNPKVNQSSNNSSRASTPSYPVRARAPSPPSSTRTSTPVSESSRNASTRQMNYGQIPSPPPPPAAKDAFTTLQHYLRLLSENCSIGNPLNYYDIKAPLDEGSSAQVFSAVSRATKHEFAIKVIPLTYSLEFIFNELYVLRNLKHKNVVEFKESFLRWDGKTREIWIVMEKCARGDVTSRAGKVTQKEVARITREILTSLSHLHAHGIIHRDIKLSNILMTATNEVKIADFGISSLTPTSTTGMVGTIPYMAPDVVNVGSDRPYSSKVDIWSLGVCVLELLTGKAAWGRIRDDEIMMRLRRGEKPYGFERLRNRSADFSWEASDFLERCFARDGEVRYSAEELLQHPFIKNNCSGSRPTQSPQI